MLVPPFCRHLAVTLAAIALAGCCSTRGDSPAASSGITPGDRVKASAYGTTSDGQEVTRYTLTNAERHSVDVIDFGGVVTAINMPDKDGLVENVALHYPGVAGYETTTAYFGGTIGRYTNRIAKGKFDLNGEAYTLATNNAPNTLHGGLKGFDKRMWDVTPVPGKSAVTLHRVSPDGEEGFPSSLDLTVTITLTDDDALRFDYDAKNTGDKQTVLNLTNHTYFNLGGAGDGTILDDVLTLDADKYLPTDETSIPTGEERPVKGTPFDFTKPHVIGERIAATDGGYDHNFILNGKPGRLRDFGKLVDPGSGRVMRMRTTEPGVQLYSGNFLDSTPANGGYADNTGLCLETQHFPDSPNQPAFPSTTLKPGDTYQSTTVYEFSTQK